jgi:hypothetical protein
MSGRCAHLAAAEVDGAPAWNACSRTEARRPAQAVAKMGKEMISELATTRT